MNFKIYDADKVNQLKKIKKEKISILTKTNDASVFLYNELTPHLTHIVLKINDEYTFGTKRGTIYSNLPFDHYINMFVHKGKSKVFIEESLDIYINIALNYIGEKTKVKLTSQLLNNNNFIKFNEHINGKISKFEYENLEEEATIEKGFTPNSDFMNITSKENIAIYYMLWKKDGNNISATSDGRIKIDNKDEKFLLNFIEVFADAL